MNTEGKPSAQPLCSDEEKTIAKKLVAYFSHTGENYNVGYIKEGNPHSYEIPHSSKCPH